MRVLQIYWLLLRYSRSHDVVDIKPWISCSSLCQSRIMSAIVIWNCDTVVGACCCCSGVSYWKSQTLQWKRHGIVETRPLLWNRFRCTNNTAGVVAKASALLEADFWPQNRQLAALFPISGSCATKFWRRSSKVQRPSLFGKCNVRMEYSFGVADWDKAAMFIRTVKRRSHGGCEETCKHRWWIGFLWIVQGE